MFLKVVSVLCAIKLFECQKKKTFEIRNIQYSIALSVNKQPSVFNTTYTIQNRVNCPTVILNIWQIHCK